LEGSVNQEELIEEQKRVMLQWFEGFEKGDVPLAYAGFDQDATWLGLGPGFTRVNYESRQATIDYQSAWVHKVWQGEMHYKVLCLLADGNTVVAEWEDEAVSVEGDKYTNRGVHVFEFDGTPTVKRARMYVDFEPLMQHISRFEQARVNE
jgi:ketosteroid isomerase-like protein